MKTNWLLTAGALVAIALSLGCASAKPVPAETQARAQAKEGAPRTAQVEVASVPYDPALPRYVVAVLPLENGSSDLGPDYYYSRHHEPVQPPFRVGIGMSAQLTTALTHAGNISVIEAEMLQRQADGTYTCKLQPGEIGPFIVKGIVTEFNETVEASESTQGASLGGPGAVMGIAGAIAHESGLGWTGAGLALANPTMESTERERKGMVGLDLKLVDGRSGRIIRGYPCAGTFTTYSSTSGMSLFGIGGGSSTFAQSALGQATRAAMNQAVQQTAQALTAAPHEVK